MMTFDESNSSRFLTKFATFARWSIVCVTTVGLGLKLWPLMNSSPFAASSQTGGVNDLLGTAPNTSINSSANSSIGTLLGAQSKVLQNAPDLALTRLGLAGVLQSSDGQGVALISLDSQTPKPYRIGAKVGDSLILSSVEERGVSFKLVGEGSGLDSTTPLSTNLRLELPRKNGVQGIQGAQSVQGVQGVQVNNPPKNLAQISQSPPTPAGSSTNAPQPGLSVGGPAHSSPKSP